MRRLRHVPDLVAQWAADTPHLTRLAREGTLLHADVTGFTAISERLEGRGARGTEELIDTLNRIFGAVLDTAAGRGGDLLKFGGDALLFLFTGDGHAVRAAATAAELHREVRRAAAQRSRFGRLRLVVSIGLASGDVDVLLVGRGHRELVVAGPVLAEVLAAEKDAGPGQTRLAPSTVLLLPRTAVADPAGRALLRWRRAPASLPPAPRPRPEVSQEILRTLLPTGLAAMLAVGVEPGHRVATIAFVRCTGLDSLLLDGESAAVAAADEVVSTATEVFASLGVHLYAVDAAPDGFTLFAGIGAPNAEEDEEARMVRAVTRLVGTPLPLRLAAGVNRGHVVGAEIGSDARAAYSAMGDTTNTAARIAARAEPGTVLVHPAVLDRANALFEAASVGPFVFKGKALPLTVYAVGRELGHRDEDTDRGLPLLGREAPVAALERLVASLREGAGDVVTIGAAAGLGKTRLAREVLGDAGVRVVVARGEPSLSTTPYGAVGSAVRDLLGTSGPDGDAGDVGAALAALDPDLAPYAALVGDVIHVATPETEETREIAPNHRPDRTADIVLEVLRRAASGPLVIAVEDAQWVDAASTALIRRVEQATATEPWLLVVLRRPGPDGFAADGGESLALDRLDDSVVTDLVLAASESTPLRPHEVARVVASADGNPRYVAEWARAVASSGAAGGVPDSLVAVLLGRVDALAGPSRRALAAASVLGRSFPAAWLDGVLAREGQEIDEPTQEDLDDVLVRIDADRLRFGDGLLREVLYDSLPFGVRARLHAVAAAVIEATGGAADEQLAEHHARAEAAGPAWTHGLAAARRAASLYANADAAALLERALGFAVAAGVGPDERAEWTVVLGDLYERAGHYDAALAAYGRASRTVRAAAPERAALLLRRARAHERAGAYPTVLRTARRAERLVRGNPRAAETAAQAHVMAAKAHQRQENPEAAQREARRAYDLAERAGAAGPQARAANLLSWSAMMQGDDDAARRWGQKAVDLYGAAGDRDGQADMANNLGVMAFFAGDWGATLGHYQVSRDACAAVGNLVDAAITDNNIGEVLVSQHRAAEAEPVLRTARRVLRSAGHRWGMAFADMHLGRLHLLVGDVDLAVATLTGARADFRALGQPASAYEATLYLAAALTRSGEPDQALRELDLAAADATDDVAVFAAEWGRHRSEALLALGRRPEAAATIEAALRTARSRGLGYETGQLLGIAAGAGLCAPEVSEAGADPAAESARVLAGFGVR